MRGCPCTPMPAVGYSTVDHMQHDSVVVVPKHMWLVKHTPHLSLCVFIQTWTHNPGWQWGKAQKSRLTSGVTNLWITLHENVTFVYTDCNCVRKVCLWVSVGLCPQERLSWMLRPSQAVGKMRVSKLIQPPASAAVRNSRMVCFVSFACLLVFF